MIDDENTSGSGNDDAEQAPPPPPPAEDNWNDGTKTGEGESKPRDVVPTHKIKRRIRD